MANARWLIVGLGNSKDSYARTPHNVGFDAVTAAAGRDQLSWRSLKDKVLATPVSDDGAVYAKPLSFMNTSGPCVVWAQKHWNVPAAQTLVVCDDFALPWGRLRLRRSGSSGGHNGLKSVIESIGHPNFPRLRVGVGPVPEGMDPADYVLRRASQDKMAALAVAAADAVLSVIKDGLEPAMNLFNAPKEEKK